MQVRPGQIPIRRFQRHLIEHVCGLLSAIILSAVLSYVFLPQRFVPIVALPLAICLIAVMLWRMHLAPSSCPYCHSDAEYAEGSEKLWRYRFPYGFATTCRACGADLAVPYDGTTRCITPN